MMKRYALGCAAALALTVGVGAQTPTTPQTQTASPPTSSAQAGTPNSTRDESAPVTIEGCLVRERDVPGRKMNPVEQAGIMDDFILQNIKMVKGSAPSSAVAGTSAARPGDTPTGTSGSSAAMFDVKGLQDSQLRNLVGRRVQIDGAFGDAERSANAGKTEDLVDIRGTAIRSVDGDCPAGK